MSKDTIDGETNTGLSMLAGGGLSPRGSYEIRSLADAERAYIEAVLMLCNGNIPRAAEILEVAPSTIYRKKSRWDHED